MTHTTSKKALLRRSAFAACALALSTGAAAQSSQQPSQTLDLSAVSPHFLQAMDKYARCMGIPKVPLSHQFEARRTQCRRLLPRDMSSAMREAIAKIDQIMRANPGRAGTPADFKFKKAE